jgi:hypothetical protein
MEMEIMESESEQLDPRDVLSEKLLDVATQIYTARVDSQADNQSRRARTNYTPADAVAEAATLMTMALSPDRAEAAFADAALRVGAPSLWPPEDDGKADHDMLATDTV